MDKVVAHLPIALVRALDAIGLLKGKRTAKLRFHHILGGRYEEARSLWLVVSHLGSCPSAPWGIHASKFHTIGIVF